MVARDYRNEAPGVGARKDFSMKKRMMQIAIVAGCAIAAGAAVQTIRGRRAAEESKALELDIARFENEGGRTGPL